MNKTTKKILVGAGGLVAGAGIGAGVGWIGSIGETYEQQRHVKSLEYCAERLTYDRAAATFVCAQTIATYRSEVGMSRDDTSPITAADLQTYARELRMELPVQAEDGTKHWVIIGSFVGAACGVGSVLAIRPHEASPQPTTAVQPQV